MLHDAAGQTLLADVEPERDGNRFNDARCDAAGRLWAGTMSTTRESGAAALYRVDPDGACERILAGTTISNGLGWAVTASGCCSSTRRPSRSTSSTSTPPPDARATAARSRGSRRNWGCPTGSPSTPRTASGSRFFGGGALHRYDTDGTLSTVVPLPVTNPTCPAFAGPDLATLVITSARHRLSAEQLAAEPRAGAVLALPAPSPGRPPHRFAG